jgi:hypothetical protein
MSNFSKTKNKLNVYLQNKNNNISRYELLSIFSNKLTPLLPKNIILNIAVIGGSKFEPEIQFINQSKKVTVFGIDKDSKTNYLDLNKKYKNQYKSFHGTFDLILFNQTLEHIWNHSNTFIIFKKFLKKKRFLWVTCPCSNIYHNSPEYYSAGFTYQYINKIAENHNLKTVYSNSFGSERLYKFIHLKHTWPTYEEYYSPVLYFILNHRNYFKSKIISRIILSFANKDFTNNDLYKSETFGIYMNK